MKNNDIIFELENPLSSPNDIIIEDEELIFNNPFNATSIEEIPFGDDAADISEKETNTEISKETNSLKKTEKNYILRGKKKLYKTKTEYVYRLDDGSYAYRLYIKEPYTNTYIYENINSGDKFKTEKSAAEALAEHKFTLKQNGKVDKNKKYTFNEVWESFKNSEHGRAFETLRRYDSIHRIHIAPVFGDKYILDISSNDYTQLLTRLYRTGDYNKKKNHIRNIKKTSYSYSYVYSIYKFFKLVLHYASTTRIITLNDYTATLSGIKLPEKKKKSDLKDIRVLTAPQIKAIKKLLKGTDYYLPFLISITCGTRPAETFGLQFSDFDFKNNTVNINKQIVEENGIYAIKTPKTEMSKRTISVPENIMQEVLDRMKHLEYWRNKHPKNFALNIGKAIDYLELEEKIIDLPEDLICRDSKGKYFSAHSFSYYSKIIRKDICPDDDKYEDFSFYTFRKTHLSQMASNNCPVGELMRRAGHSKPDTIYKYYFNSTETSTDKMLDALRKSTSIF